MNNEERQDYIKRKIDRFKNINSQHQATINEYCSDVRQMRRIIQENEELIEKLEIGYCNFLISRKKTDFVTN